MKIYPDVCCYSRPYDKPEHMEQLRIRQEVAAIMDALNSCALFGFPIIGGVVVEREISRIPQDGKRHDVLDFYFRVVTEEAFLSNEIDARAAVLMAANVKQEDAYHVATAEAYGADYLLTTDKRLLNASKRLVFYVNVINPVDFMEEYKKWRLY